MIAAKYDLKIDAGSDYSQVFILTDPSTVTTLNPDGDPINVSGYTAVAQIRKNYDDINPLLTFTCVVGTTDGSITIKLDKALTKSLPFEYPAGQRDKPIKAVWDIQVTDTTPFTQRLQLV